MFIQSKNQEDIKPCLYVVSTPIGNLNDITLRALEVLKGVDFIIVENTSISLKLLNHYEIKKPLIVYFGGNEEKRSEKILKELKKGKTGALITSAGTPCISDPGDILVRKCYKNGIRVIPVPGPSALTTALSISGVGNQQFIFLGFLPRSKARIKKIFLKIPREFNVILYESPYRVKRTLEIVYEVFGDVEVILFKELTKRFEDVIIDKVKVILTEIEEKLKGEYVILINLRKDKK